MNCPKCGGKTKVVDTGNDDKRVYRRRECVVCKHRIYTTELVMDGSKYFLSRVRNKNLN